MIGQVRATGFGLVVCLVRCFSFHITGEDGSPVLQENCKSNLTSVKSIYLLLLFLQFDFLTFRVHNFSIRTFLKSQILSQYNPHIIANLSSVNLHVAFLSYLKCIKTNVRVQFFHKLDDSLTLKLCRIIISCAHKLFQCCLPIVQYKLTVVMFMIFLSAYQMKNVNFGSQSKAWQKPYD